MIRSLIACLLALVGGVAGATEPPLPQDSAARFLGVDTCGSSQCHGSPEPWRNATVMMKERLIWQAHDPHAKAWQSLVGERGAAIAAKLGIAEPGKAPECLGCHATLVPAAQQGPAFDVEDGVGCESCHGPGGAFLRTHVQPTSTHAGNVAAGMYPTTDPAARARLCLSCHQGDDDHAVNHRLYGAGHPRLRFELDTYSALQPYHFNPDADYRRRKPVPTHFALWAGGQLAAARALLASLDTAAPRGLFPELAHYDCHGCHRALGDGQAGAPTMPRLLDTPLAMSAVVAQVLMPAAAGGLTEGRTELARAVHDPAALASVRTRLDATLAALAATAHGAPRDPALGARALAALLADARARAPLPFAHAEALAMALSTLVMAEFEAGRLAPPDRARADAGLDAVYAALADENTYQPHQLAAALDQLAAALPLTSESP
ncbi:MAG: multiheme c-type cytochrome [Gammaproteobacteria bacterium]